MAGSTRCWRRPRMSACTCSPSCSCVNQALSSEAWCCSARSCLFFFSCRSSSSHVAPLLLMFFSCCSSSSHVAPLHLLRPGWVLPLDLLMLILFFSFASLLLMLLLFIFRGLVLLSQIFAYHLLLSFLFFFFIVVFCLGVHDDLNLMFWD